MSENLYGTKLYNRIASLAKMLFAMTSSTMVWEHGSVYRALYSPKSWCKWLVFPPHTPLEFLPNDYLVSWPSGTHVVATKRGDGLDLEKSLNSFGLNPGGSRGFTFGVFVVPTNLGVDPVIKPANPIGVIDHHAGGKLVSVSHYFQVEKVRKWWNHPEFLELELAASDATNSGKEIQR